MVGEIKWWLNYHEYQGNADEKANEILNELNDPIKKSISPAGSIAGPFPVSLVNPSFLDGVSSKLNKFLSEKVTTV